MLSQSNQQGGVIMKAANTPRFLFTITLLSILFFQLPIMAEVKKGSNTYTKIKIVGSIINFSEIAKYMSKESYFQIVKIPKNDRINGYIDGKGRLKVDSELPILEISADGLFPDKILNLEPGKYTIFPQLLGIAGNQNSNLVFVNTKALLDPYKMEKLFLKNITDKKLVVISVPENPKNIVLINIGEVMIPSPENSQ